MSFYSLTSYSQLRVNQAPLSSGGGSLLLDQHPGSSVAYSLRKLSSSFSGSPVRVRRDNDNQEQDIPFDGDSIDETNLLNFVGSNSGYIVKWYDQSGNNNDAYVNTASYQARIVRQGLIRNDAVNGKITTVWDRSQYVITNTLTTVLEYYNINVFRRTNRSTNFITTLGHYSNSPRVFSWATHGSGNLRQAYMNSTKNFGASTTQGTFIVETYRESDNDIHLYFDGSQVGATPSDTGVNSTLTRFGARGSVRTTGEYQELIYWPDNTYNNRASIYANVESYYQ